MRRLKGLVVVLFLNVIVILLFDFMIVLSFLESLMKFLGICLRSVCWSLYFLIWECVGVLGLILVVNKIYMLELCDLSVDLFIYCFDIFWVKVFLFVCYYSRKVFSFWIFFLLCVFLGKIIYCCFMLILFLLFLIVDCLIVLVVLRRWRCF